MSRFILTAGHCICTSKPPSLDISKGWIYARENPLRRIWCTEPNDKNDSPPNQIVPGRREISYFVGKGPVDIDAKERSREEYEVAIGKYPQVEKAFKYHPKLQDIGLLIANVFINNKLHLPTIPTGLDFIIKYDFKDYIYFTIDIASRYVNLMRMNHLALHGTTVHTAVQGGASGLSLENQCMRVQIQPMKTHPLIRVV